MANRSTWSYHPILVFIFSILALATSLFLYIYWYMEVSSGIETVIEKYHLDPEQILESETWVVILVLSILVGIILMGIFTIFVYHQKTLQLYRRQQNFFNSFTHELKTPVTSLRLYLETFLRYELSRDDQIKYVRYMVQDVNRLSDNINRILDLAKIESKSYGGQFVQLDPVQTIEHFCENNDHLFKDCEINIHSPLNQSFLSNINTPLFEMLLMNLLINAIKYNDSETPKIDVTFTLHNGKLHIGFADNGIGLDKRDIKKIFKKFYQVDNRENLSRTGSGIGLHLAQLVAKLHKGKVIAESKGRGNGSVLTLILPCSSPNKMEI